MDCQFVPTVCPYCGVGCKLILQVQDGQVVGTFPAKDGPSNNGRLCVKGWSVHEFVQHPDRLTKPLIQENGSSKEVGWSEALNYGAARIKSLRDTHGPESVVFVGSARCTNEECFIFQKFARALFGHNHVDHCARL